MKLPTWNYVCPHDILFNGLNLEIIRRNLNIYVLPFFFFFFFLLSHQLFSPFSFKTFFFFLFFRIGTIMFFSLPASMVLPVSKVVVIFAYIILYNLFFYFSLVKNFCKKQINKWVSKHFTEISVKSRKFLGKN